MNGHNTYDYTTFVRGNCEFISEQAETERYVWRFCTKSNIPNWVLDVVSEWGGEENPTASGITNDICMIEDSVIYYPFK
jgi:hypothetical protein